MQHRLSNMIGYTIRATDGDLGKVDEFYFDDTTWTVRYLVVETGNWLLNRKVLLSPVALGKPDWESHTFTVNLTCDQVRNSPDIDTQKPVYRQHEVEIHEYYLWPRYWEGSSGGIFGLTSYPLLEGHLEEGPPVSGKKEDPHLRSTRQVSGYHVHATDGNIGTVEGFFIDDETWAIRYIAVDTGNWLPGKKVLVSSSWIKCVDWDTRSVYLKHSQEAVKNSPEFNNT